MRDWLAAALLLASPAFAPVPAQDVPGPVVAALDHVALHVSDLDASAAFYAEVFGLEQIPAPVPNARWLQLGNGATLHLVAGRIAPVAAEKWDHFAIGTADLDALIVRLERLGIAWSDIQGNPAPQVRADGARQIFVTDPDGYWIEVNDALRPDG